MNSTDKIQILYAVEKPLQAQNNFKQLIEIYKDFASDPEFTSVKEHILPKLAYCYARTGESKYANATLEELQNLELENKNQAFNSVLLVSLFTDGQDVRSDEGKLKVLRDFIADPLTKAATISIIFDYELLLSAT